MSVFVNALFSNFLSRINWLQKRLDAKLFFLYCYYKLYNKFSKTFFTFTCCTILCSKIHIFIASMATHIYSCNYLTFILMFMYQLTPWVWNGNTFLFLVDQLQLFSLSYFVKLWNYSQIQNSFAPEILFTL